MKYALVQSILSNKLKGNKERKTPTQLRMMSMRKFIFWQMVSFFSLHYAQITDCQIVVVERKMMNLKIICWAISQQDQQGQHWRGLVMGDNVAYGNEFYRFKSAFAER